MYYLCVSQCNQRFGFAQNFWDDKVTPFSHVIYVVSCIKRQGGHMSTSSREQFITVAPETLIVWD